MKMEKDAKIFVAGIAGMVGRAIFRFLKNQGYRNILGSYHHHKPNFEDISDLNFRLVKIDLRRQENVDALFGQEKPDYVFLTAAKVGGILANNTYKADFIYDNLMITANVIHAAYRFGAKKLLNLGSSCIYPKFAEQPLKEEFLLTGPLEPTNEAYAIAKISAIKLCRYFNEQYGTEFISIMPTNLYGPNDNFNLETSHVLPALIRKFHLADLLWKIQNQGIGKETLIQDVNNYSIGYNIQLKQEQVSVSAIAEALEKIGITADTVTLWGSGKAFREFLYVDDLADACGFIMHHFSPKDLGEFINVGTGKDIRIKDLAEMVRNIVGYKGHIEYDTTKPDGTPKKLLDITRMNALGWHQKTDLKDGITKTLNWYRSYRSEGDVYQ